MLRLRAYLSSQEPSSPLQARLGSLYRLWGRIAANPIGLISFAAITAVLILPLLAPILPLPDPTAQSLGDRLLPPSSQHWLGTDSLGRDLLSRTIWGGRPTFGIVLIVLILTAPTGLFIGALAGFSGGWIERIVMRFCDIFMAFPRLVLALAIAAVLGADPTTMIIAISLTVWTPYARVARAEAQGIKNLDFIQASLMLGCSRARILFKHVLPLCLPSMVVRMALDIPGIILVISGLGFLGLGLKPPTPEWGSIVADGRSVVFEAWWVSTWPGLMILVSGLAFNVFGDVLRDALDQGER